MCNRAEGKSGEGGKSGANRNSPCVCSIRRVLAATGESASPVRTDTLCGRHRERERERDDAPVTGFFEFQLITRCKHRLGGEGEKGRNLCCAPGSFRGGCTFRCFRPRWRSTWLASDAQLRNVSGQRRQQPWSHLSGRWLRLHARISAGRAANFRN